MSDSSESSTSSNVPAATSSLVEQSGPAVMLPSLPGFRNDSTTEVVTPVPVEEDPSRESEGMSALYDLIAGGVAG